MATDNFQNLMNDFKRADDIKERVEKYIASMPSGELAKVRKAVQSIDAVVSIPGASYAIKLTPGQPVELIEPFDDAGNQKS